jgi:nicotinamidase-related amidase
MPVTILDPQSALIVVDLQKGLVGVLAASIWDGVVTRSQALAKAFRDRGRPVVIVTADGSAPGRTERDRHFDVPPGFADPLDALDLQPDDIFVVKQTWGAFTHNDLEAQLRALGITQVVIVGVATSIGVESTARQAYEAGFNVTLAIDAMADLSPETHDHSIASIFPRLGETGLAADIIALLDGARSWQPA